MRLREISERAANMFARCFDQPPACIVAAPGRVNMIGEHTDYNDGFVLPMAIDRFTVIAGRPNGKREITLHSLTTGETAIIPLTASLNQGEPAWSNYVRGVIAGFQSLKVKVNGFDAVIDSDVPLGGGLSSSAALEVAAATLLETMFRHPLDPVEKALLCQKAEHDFAGVPCGIMDQFTSVLSRENHLLLLDCRSRRAKYVPFTAADLSVLIVNTNVRHKLADGAYAQRRAQCKEAARVLKVRSLRDATIERLNTTRQKLDPIVFRRAQHVILENARTKQAAKAFSAADWANVGELMYASHASLRDDYEVSCPELDTVVEIARDIGKRDGVIGCRMTGAGFGGCAVALVKSAAARLISRHISDEYERRTRTNPTLFICRPAGGATVIQSGIQASASA